MCDETWIDGGGSLWRGVQGSPKRCGVLEGACNVWKVSGSTNSLGRWRLKTKVTYPKEEVNKSDKLAQEFNSNFTIWLILQLHESSPLIYSMRGLKLKWENSNEKHLNLAPIPSHKGSVTWFLSLAPFKSTPTPSFYVTWKVFPYANTVPHRSGIEAKGSLYTPSSLHPLRRLLRTKPWRSTALQSGQYLECGDWP